MNRRSILIAGSLVLLVLAAWAYSRFNHEPYDPQDVKLPPPEVREVLADQATEFWAQVSAQQPRYSEVTRECPADKTKFKLNTLDARQDNMLGGVATDMMKLALAPPPAGAGHGPPDLNRQQYDLLPGTCPTCGATYFDLDLLNLNNPRLVPNGPANLAGWNLGKVAPQLVQRDQATWTFEERQFARYLTQRQAGFPHTELAYTALAGAYCSNFSAAQGRGRHLPSAAFYALAAAEFRVGRSEWQQFNPLEQAYAAMLEGECQRLLGHAQLAQPLYADARRLFQEQQAEHKKRQAEPGIKADLSDALGQQLKGMEVALAVLDQLDGLLAASDFSLQRSVSPGVETPPTGWYLDELLPYINGNLASERSAWAEAGPEPDAISAAMLELPPG